MQGCSPLCEVYNLLLRVGDRVWTCNDVVLRFLCGLYVRRIHTTMHLGLLRPWTADETQACLLGSPQQCHGLTFQAFYSVKLSQQLVDHPVCDSC